MTPQILIVHADDTIRQTLENAIQKLGYQTASLPSDAKARQYLQEQTGAKPHIVILDVSDPRASAPLIKELREQPCPPAVIASTTVQNQSAAAVAMRIGAADFIILPVHVERLAATIANALKISTLQSEIERMSHHAAGQTVMSDIVALSPSMQRALDLARRAAKSDLPILLEGEKGVGKETIARAIHQESALAKRPFVKIAVGANRAVDITASIASAEDCVLFIDDIADASPQFQDGLLSLFGSKGAKLPRIICATGADLIADVKSGRFMQDLFYRLNVFPISIPPLRNRLDDIGELVRRLLPGFSIEQGKRVDSIDAVALRLLKKYPWPGNLAQFESAVFRAVALADGPTLSVGEFPQIAARVEGYDIEIPPAPLPKPKIAYDGPAMIGSASVLPGSMALRPSHAGAYVGIPALNENGDIRPLTAIEADIIRLALGHYRGHMTQIARKLGIGRSTLYRKIREFGLGFSVH